jgi:hypothetical protein
MLPEMIVEALQSTLAPTVESHFADYLRGHDTTRWLIFSDYVLKQPDRPNDVYSFTIVPGGKFLESLTAEFDATAVKDFKRGPQVGEEMLHLLSDKRLYTFCFIVDPSRTITRNVVTLRQMIDATIEMMGRWQDAERNQDLIRAFKAMRRKADSRGFNVRLMDDIIVATTLASFLTYLICKLIPVERIGWFSDRDSITTAHQYIANHFYAVNVSALCQRYLKGWRGPQLGINGPVEAGGTLWSDAFLRVPDHFAGAISAWNIEQNSLSSTAPKYLRVMMDSVADKVNVHILRLKFDWQDEKLFVASSRVAVSLATEDEKAGAS